MAASRCCMIKLEDRLDLGVWDAPTYDLIIVESPKMSANHGVGVLICSNCSFRNSSRIGIESLSLSIRFKWSTIEFSAPLLSLISMLNSWRRRCPWQFDRKQKRNYLYSCTRMFISLTNFILLLLVKLILCYNEVPRGLPPLRGIEHQIELIPGCPIPNRPTYRTNLEETKEIQKQGFVRESLSPCFVPVILVPKKDGT
ncbi:hypothetical protein CR513_43298, partial [Mucuna pruriens]